MIKWIKKKIRLWKFKRQLKGHKVYSHTVKHRDENGVEYITEAYVIDMTEIFGQGNEPSGEEMDKLMNDVQTIDNGDFSEDVTDWGNSNE